MKLTKKEFEKILKDKVVSECGVTLDVASAEQIYRCMAMIVRQIMSDRQKQFQAKTLGEGKKQVYYLCMEFLMGRSLRTSLFNLGLNEVAEQVLADADIKIDTIYEQEPDAGLGNGGLGRLAACYLDGMATDCIPGTGYSILYEYGIFKQKIVDGWQQETADNWLPGGQVWIKSHPDQAQEIRFDGQAIETWEGGFHHVKYENYNSVIAVPNDMYVAGYGTQGVSKLRLWQAKAPSFDMSSFNAGNYNTAISQSASAELISKILYPNDNHTEGKILRLRQQYFFSAASVADILGNHLNQYGTLENLPDKIAIQLNDTHPTIAIPEMMRILLDECSYEWDAAFDICRKVFAYTNHTVMSEALEKWNVDIFRSTLPRIWQIVQEMDRRCRADLEKAFPGDQGKINYMAIIGDNQVRMANICAYTCHSINGVSKLHSEIIKDSVFHDYFLYKPKAFKNVTNGIAYRRWLLAANPGLTKLLEDSIGPGFKQDASELKKFEKFADDSAMLDKLAAVKRELEDRLVIVMRVYFEKPRTTIGWKGLINDPDLDGRFNIRKGMWLARKVLTDVLSLGLPAATEWLDPITPQYICDAISWGAIGARNTESQVHRELASGLSMPVGFKNSTDGSIKAAADSCFAAGFEHHFLSINLDGRVISAETKGNPDCHLVLRGSSHGPNYDAESVRQALEDLKVSKASGPSQHGLVIDAAHGNCGKDENREAEVIEEIAERLAHGEQGITGVMMESFLVGGHQKPAPLDQLVYGQSVTDSCVPWERTNELLHTLADAVTARRSAK